MNLQQFDDVLQGWKVRLSAIAENLMELQSDSTYQSLTGTGGLEKVGVEGATAAKVGAALRTMNELFLRYGLLQSTVDRAVEIRSGLPSLFGSEAKLQSLYHLLFTRCIDLETSDVPLAERHLLSGSQTLQKVSLDELLESMTRTFSQVRDAVTEVGKAWSEYGRCVERIEGEIGRYRSQAAMPSRLLEPSLEALEAKLLKTHAQMQNDPVGALESLHAQVEPIVASLHQQIVRAEELHRKLLAARSRWQMLDALHREAVAVSAEALARLSPSSCGNEPVPAEKLQALSDWLDRLDRKRDEGTVEAVTIGLRNWSAVAEQCLAQDRKLVTECEAKLDSRGELRGRLDALTAKARARGLAEDTRLRALRMDAEELLSARPTDLRLAGEAVAHFEHRLREHSAHSEVGRSEAVR